MRKILISFKNFLEKIDRLRDKIFFIALKKLWPKKILPDHISWVRVFIGFIILSFLFFGIENKTLIISLFVIGAFSDLLDGSVARCFKKETEFGAILDPLADRVLLAPIAFYSLFQSYTLLLFILIIVEIANAFASIYSQSKNILLKSNIFGKTKMVLQSVVFAVILIVWPNPLSMFFIYILWISAIFTILSMLLKIYDIQNLTPLNKSVNKDLIKKYAKNIQHTHK
jgi:CDP-diacylglycerol--glycerol-3-phosphate 3-phosphatidyltransferase